MSLNTEELYRNLFETSKDSILVVEQETGSIVDINTSACKLYGYSKEEFLKLNVTDISAEPEKTKSTVRNFETSVPIRFHYKKDGTRFPVEITIGYFKLNDKFYLNTFIKDLTLILNSRQEAETTNELLQTIFDVSPLAITLVDAENKVRMWNKSAERLFGWKVEEIIGKENPIVPKELSDEYNLLVDEIVDKGNISDREIIRQRKDGTLVDLNISSSAVYNKNGQYIGRMAILQDITERKQLEEKLKENEVIFSSFLEHSPVYVFFKDKEIRAIRLSSNFEQMLGIPVQQALGKTMDDLFPSDLAKSMIADDMKILDEGQRVEVTEELGSKVYSTIKFPILKDGKPLMLAGFTQDITEQRKMLEELEMLKHSVDRHFDGAYWMDPNDRFIYVNDAGCDILQYTREEMLNMHVSDVNPFATPDTMSRVWQKLRDEGAYVSETVHRRKDGTEFPVEISSTLVRFGNKEYNCGFARDITDRKKIQKELVASEAILSSLIMNRKESIFSIDKDFRYVIINDMFKTSYLSAYGVELKPGMHATDILPSDLVDFWKEKYRKALAGEVVVFEFSEVVFNERHFFSVNITPIIINEEVIGASVISIDITNRKRGEEALQRSEEKFRRMAEQMIDILFTTDTKGVITYLSPSCQKVFGNRPDEMIGHEFIEFLEESSKEIFWSNIKKEDSTMNLILNMKTKSGEIFPGEISSSVTEDNLGNVVGTLGIIRNISEKVAFEETLTNERNQLRILIDNLPDFIFFKDATGKYIVNNKAHLISIGQKSQEEVFGKTAFDLHHKEFAEKYNVDESEIIQSGQAMIDKEENVFRFDLGEVRWHLTSKIPIKDKKGRVTSLVGISRDITERKKIEEALKISEERLRLALDGANDGIWDVDMETGAVYLSPRGCEILGYRPDELSELEKVWSDLVYSGDLPTTYENLNTYLQGKVSYFEVEQRLKTKSGQLKWILTRGKATEWLPDGQPKRMIGTHTDINNRKQIEDALKESEEKYRQLFENMTVGFALHQMIYDNNGNPIDYRFLEINPAFEKLTGLKASEITGKTVKEAIPNVEQYWIDFYGTVAKSRVPASYQNFAADFSKYYDVWVFSPSQDQFATIFNDITEQKLSQEALKNQNEEY